MIVSLPRDDIILDFDSIGYIIQIEIVLVAFSKPIVFTRIMYAKCFEKQVQLNFYSQTKQLLNTILITVRYNVRIVVFINLHNVRLYR